MQRSQFATGSRADSVRLRRALLVTLILALTPLAALATPIAKGSATIVEGTFGAASVDITVTKEFCTPGYNDCLASPDGFFEYLLVASSDPGSLLEINVISALFPISTVHSAGFFDNPFGTAAPNSTIIEDARVAWVFVPGASVPAGATTETLFVASDLDLSEIDVFVEWQFGFDAGASIHLAPIPEPSAALMYLTSIALVGTATRHRARRRGRSRKPGR